MWIALYGLQPTGVPDRSSVSIRKLETGFGLNPALPHPCEVPINLHQDPRQFLLVTLLPTTPQALLCADPSEHPAITTRLDQRSVNETEDAHLHRSRYVGIRSDFKQCRVRISLVP